jgi:hypothetical protein
MGNSQESPARKKLGMSYLVFDFYLSALRVYLSYAKLNTDWNPLPIFKGRFRPKK